MEREKEWWHRKKKGMVADSTIKPKDLISSDTDVKNVG